MKYSILVLVLLSGVGCNSNEAGYIGHLNTIRTRDSMNISALRITVDTVENQLGELQAKYDSLSKEAQPVLPFDGQVVEYRGQIMTWEQGEWLLGCVHAGCALRAHKQATERTAVESVNQSGGVTAGVITNNQP